MCWRSSRKQFSLVVLFCKWSCRSIFTCLPHLLFCQINLVFQSLGLQLLLFNYWPKSNFFILTWSWGSVCCASLSRMVDQRQHLLSTCYHFRASKKVFLETTTFGHISFRWDMVSTAWNEDSPQSWKILIHTSKHENTGHFIKRIYVMAKVNYSKRISKII